MKKKRIYTILGIILLFFGLGSFIYNSKFTQNSFVNHSQSTIMKKTNKNDMSKANKKKGNFNPNDTSIASQSTVIKNAIKAKHVFPIGIMSIPDIKITNPILKGYGNDGSYLALGACTAKANDIMGQGNYALVGHYMNSNTVFHSLNKAKPGMKIYITDKKNIYTYQVTSNQTIDHMDVNVLNDTQIPSITLITCKGLNETPLRTCVKGKLIAIHPSTNKLLKQYQLEN